MLYILCVYIILSLLGINLKKISNVDKDALSKDRTTMINGFFVGIILLSHFDSYLDLSGFTNLIYLKIIRQIGQLMVTTFFFYSGYGILESIKNKKNYINNFLKNRVFKLFVAFSVAIIMYLILGVIIGNSYSLKTILLSFIGWESVGNSNWFVFATFCLYLFTYISFKLFKKETIKGILLTTILIFIYIFLLVKFKGSTWWCDTILCYSLGMLVSYYRDRILEILKDTWNYILILLLVIIIFLFCRLQGYNYFIYNIESMAFVTIIFLLTLRIKIGNVFLLWMGKNTFNIYMLQRIGYILYEKLGLSNYNIYVYFAASVCTTLLLVFIFDKLLKLIYKTMKL